MFLSVFGICLFAFSASANAEIQPGDASRDQIAAEYAVSDEVTDVAALPDGGKAYKVYSAPRLLYKDASGALRVRPPGWNLFNEQPESRLRNDGAGYSFRFPLNGTDAVRVSAGNMEIGSVATLAPQAAKFVQTTEDFATVSVYDGVYDNVDVQFRDIKRWRYRSIVIKQKPVQAGKNDVITFWEHYDLPPGASVMDRQGNGLVDGATLTGDTVIKADDGSKFTIGGAQVGDATDSDLARKVLTQKIAYDQALNRLSIGIMLDGEYLNDPARVYPVTIDPQYDACKEGQNSRPLANCRVADLYLGWHNWNNGTSSDLFLGYTNDGQPAPRQIVTYFDLSGLPAYEYINTARLRLTYDRPGLGTVTNALFRAHRIDLLWDTSTNSQGVPNTTLTYNDVWNYLSPISGATFRPFTTDPQGRVDGPNVTEAVRSWHDQGWANRGLLVQNDAGWTRNANGTWSDPGWPDRIFIFKSSRDATDTGPYLFIDTLPDPLEPNNNFSQAYDIGSNTSYVNQQLALSPGDEDWFKFQYNSQNYYFKVRGVNGSTNGKYSISFTRAGASVDIYTNIVSGQIDTYLQLYGPDGATHLASDDNGGSVGFSRIIYSITAAADPLEPNNDWSQAYNIGTNTSYANTQLLLTAGDEDWFKFTYNNQTYYFKIRGLNSSTAGPYGISFSLTGASVTIATTIVSGNVDTFLHLYGPDHTTQLAADDDSNGSGFSRLTYTLTQTDLAIADASLTNASGLKFAGDTLNFNARFQNLAGGAVSNVPFRVQLIDTSGNSFNLDNLSPGGLSMSAGFDQSVTVSGRIPATINPFLTYRARLTIDPNNTVNDSNTANNTREAAESIIVERYSYTGGGGGGGGTPNPSCPNNDGLPDADGDCYSDRVEKTGNTNVAGAQIMPLNGSNSRQHVRTQGDVTTGNVGGDPVNTRTGAFEFSQTDFALPGRGIPITFERTYNSRVPDLDGRLGFGWNHSYNIYAYQDPNTFNVFINFGSLLAAVFTSPDNGLTFAAPAGVADTLTLQGGVFTYRTLNGNRYVFGAPVTRDLRMIEAISDPNGNATRFAYTTARDVPLLTMVTDASGRSIRLEYVDMTGIDVNWSRIRQLTDLVNPAAPRAVTYTYDNNRDLTRVDETRTYEGNTDTITHAFTYNPATHHLLTYTDPRGTILHNEYDSAGRVLDQFETNPRVDTGGGRRKMYHFDYQSADPAIPGSVKCTLVTNFRSGTETYTQRDCYNADELLIYRADGLGNASRYTYYPSGMIASETDPSGNRTDFEYDGRRRLTKKVMPDTLDWHTEESYGYEDNFNRLTSRVERARPASIPSAPFQERTATNDINPANGNARSHTDFNNFTASFTYDAVGNIATSTDKNGAETAYAYDLLGNYKESERIAVRDANGTASSVLKRYRYDAYGNPTELTTPRNFTFRNRYDNMSNLRRAENPLGGVKQMAYDIENHLISKIDENNHATRYDYDTDIAASLRSVTRLGPDNNRTDDDISTRYEYDYLGTKTAAIDQNGNTTTYRYDNANRLASTTEPLNRTDFLYYQNGLLQSETNSANQRTDHFYDVRNRPTSQRRYRDLSSFIATSQRYDAFGRIDQATDGNGNASSFAFDAGDRLLSAADAEGNTTTYRYDRNGNRVGELLPRAQTDVSLRNGSADSITYQYDELNRLIRQTNADNKITTFAYDADSNRTGVIDRADQTGANAAHASTMAYDELNRLRRDTDAYGNYSEYTYDTVGNIRTVRDRAGSVTTSTYDFFDRRATMTDPALTVTRYDYDKAGNRTKTIQPDGTATRYEYDAHNRMTKETDVRGNFSQTGYDAIGNVTSTTDKRGYATTFAYDGLNRPMQETSPRGIITTYEYDNNGNRRFERTVGQVKEYRYDRANRLLLVSYPGGKTESYSYDRDGSVTGKTDGNNQTIAYRYDKLGRAREKVVPGVVQPITYAYDNWDNPLRVADQSGTASSTYDFLNRPVIEERTLTDLPANLYRVTRRYTPDSQLEGITDAAGRAVDYAYNNVRLLESARYNNADLARYTYDYTTTSLRQPAVIVYGNGVSTTLAYDNLHRLDTIAVRNNAPLFYNRYAYDQAGNRRQVTETDGATIDYRFDEEEQLRFADYSRIPGADDIEYHYDAWGNRSYLKNPTETVSSTITANTNELSVLSYNQGRLRVNMEYDGNGSLTREQFVRGGVPNREARYGYDGQNRLTSITYAHLNRPAWLPALPENRLEFSYSDDGNRVKKSVNGVSTYYLNDGLTVLNELNSNGAITKSLVKGLEQIAEIDSAGVVKYLHQDALGSTALMTNASGLAAQKYEYDPFGQIVGSEGGESNNTRYTGQEYDPESELAYMNARYYNPRIGRFLSRDSRIGYQADLLSRNPYIYVKNNPLKYTDPSGNEEKKKEEEEKLRKQRLVGEQDGTNSLNQSANSTAAYCLKDCGVDVNPYAVLDYFPFTGDISDAYAIQTGTTLFGQRKLSEQEKNNIGMYAMLPALTSSQGRLGAKAIEAGDKVAAKGATVAGQFLHGVPQEAIDRVMSRLKGLRIGDKPVIEAIEAFGSRTTGWSAKRNATVNAESDLDFVLHIKSEILAGRNGDWIRTVIKEIAADFQKTTKFEAALHFPKLGVSVFKNSVLDLDPLAKFIGLFKR